MTNTREKLEQGYVQIYTGNGKGKSTAGFGLALRAAGCGLNVVIIQFMKTDASYGEQLSFDKLKPNVELYTYGTNDWVKKGEASPEAIAKAHEGLSKALESITDNNKDVVILDEINNALYFELLTVEEVLNLLNQKLPHIEMVLTGRNAPAALIEVADLVTEMREIKHYYQAGVQSRKGIEY